jgi:hypothetical protein
MRFNDILLEKNLAARDFKDEIRLDALIHKLVNNLPFTNADGEKLYLKPTRAEVRYLKSLKAYYDANGTSADVKDYMPKEIGGVKLSSLFKTAEFGGKGGNPADLDAPVRTSLGETTEGLKACAIFARLTARNKPNITDKEVAKIANTVAAKMKQVTKDVVTDSGKKSKKISFLSSLTKEVADTNGTVKDKITLDVSLARAPFQRLAQLSPEDKDAWGVLSSVVNYINSETDLAKYNRFFSNNQKRDPIDIKIRGLEGEKTDIETSYTDQDGRVRPLSHLSMSVKRGSAKYDQASGLNESGNIKFFNILGLSIEDARAAMTASHFKNDLPLDKRIKAVSRLYSHAAELLDHKLATKNDAGEAIYITQLLVNLKKSIQGDQKLVYVNFNINGTYDKLNPQLIDNLARYVDLEATLEIKSTPYLYIRDKNSGKALFQVRLQKNADGRLTHIFELKDLLELTKAAMIERNKSVIAPTPTTPAAAPAAVAPVAPKATPAPVAPTATPAVAPTAVAPATTPVQPVDNKEKVEMEDMEDKDLVRIKHLSGMLSQLSKNI